MAIAIGGPGSRPAAHKRESQVTWTTDVEPILRRRCIGCHTADGFAPMSLATYEDARRWSTSIRREVLERRMPPWPAAKGFGDYGNDRSLTPVEVELLTSWADGATPLGPAIDGASAGRSTDDSAGRSTDRPRRRDGATDEFDLVLMAPEARTVTRLVDRIVLPTALREDRWVTGWELRPGNRSIVQQAVLWIEPDTPIGSWTPPDGPIVYPQGIAKRLPAGSRVALELHYRKSATAQADRSGVALRFGAQPARELRHRSLACGSTALDRGIGVLAVTPRASEAGASLEIVARHADGRIEPLSVVPRYEPAYPVTYRFRSLIRLPRATTIDVRSSVPDCSADLEFVQR